MGINIVMVAVNDVDKHVIGIKNEILYMKSFLHTGTFERCITICLFVSGNLFADDKYCAQGHNPNR